MRIIQTRKVGVKAEEEAKVWIYLEALITNHKTR